MILGSVPGNQVKPRPQSDAAFLQTTPMFSGEWRDKLKARNKNTYDALITYAHEMLADLNEPFMLQPTGCCITKGKIPSSMWWHLFLWNYSKGRWDLYGDARCSCLPVTGYYGADVSQGLCPSVIQDLWTIQDARQFADTMRGYTAYDRLIEAIPTLRDLRHKRAEK